MGWAVLGYASRGESQLAPAGHTWAVVSPPHRAALPIPPLSPPPPPTHATHPDPRTPQARGSVEISPDEGPIRPADVQNLVLWVLAEGTNPRWCFVKVWG